MPMPHGRETKQNTYNMQRKKRIAIRGIRDLRSFSFPLDLGPLCMRTKHETPTGALNAHRPRPPLALPLPSAPPASS
eukprot:3604245-Alexandrium_andersonii.AAC.1